MTGGVFPYFEVTSTIMGIAFLVAAGLGIISSIAPSISVAKMSVVDGLRTLD
jgi:ABC-type antimicrobial peptide transport system permease subunit